MLYWAFIAPKARENFWFLVSSLMVKAVGAVHKLRYAERGEGGGGLVLRNQCGTGKGDGVSAQRNVTLLNTVYLVTRPYFGYGKVRLTRGRVFSPSVTSA